MTAPGSHLTISLETRCLQLEIDSDPSSAYATRRARIATYSWQGLYTPGAYSRMRRTTMATPRCKNCGEVLRTEQTGMERTHDRKTFEVAKFRCEDCGTMGFRGWETFESSRYKSRSDAYQWGAVAPDPLYPTAPWVSQFGVFVETDEGEDEDPLKTFRSEDDAEAYAERMGAPLSTVTLNVREI